MNVFKDIKANIEILYFRDQLIGFSGSLGLSKSTKSSSSLLMEEFSDRAGEGGCSVSRGLTMEGVKSATSAFRDAMMLFPRSGCKASSQQIEPSIKSRQRVAYGAQILSITWTNHPNSRADTLATSCSRLLRDQQEQTSSCVRQLSGDMNCSCSAHAATASEIYWLCICKPRIASIWTL